MAKKAKKKSTNKQNKKPNNNQTAKTKAAQTSSSKAPQKAEQKQSKNNSLVWKVVAGVLAAALVTVSCLYIVKLNSNSDSVQKDQVSRRLRLLTMIPVRMKQKIFRSGQTKLRLKSSSRNT